MSHSPQAEPTCCCGDEFDPHSLSVEQAAQRILAAVRALDGYEKLALRDALDRVLAEDVVSPIDVPAHYNSAMDGYALAAADLPPGGARDLELIGTAWAGRPYSGTLGAGQCVRIMTGAKLPAGADTVIMQERVTLRDGRVSIGGGHRRGENVRAPGEDLALGQVALNAGKRVGPAELGLLASLGIAEVKVRRRARVAFFSTGDELRSLGEPLGEGDIYDSNRYTLHGLLSRLGADFLDMGVVPDTQDALRAAFAQAAALADAVITSGGVSVGEADFVKDILAELGTVDFWKIAMKPGKPMAFGKLGAAVFFGLPGNPVSAMVTFYHFVLPALRRMSGLEAAPPLRLRVPCRSRLKKKPGRVEFQRGILREENGAWGVYSTGAQGSGILRSMSAANCFVLLPLESSGAEAGEMVEVEPFGWPLV